MLADADIDHSKITDPAVREAIKMAHRVAAGDVHAARHVVAHYVAAEVHEAHKHAREVETAKALVASKHLSDPHFNKQVKSSMMKALFAAGVISDINDPKWHSMTAEEAARMLADADIDHSKITDPAVREAIKMAHRVAAGDVHAARHVAAHHVAASIVAHDTIERAGASGANVVPDAAFLKKSKILLVNALSAVGLAPRPLDSADWKDVTLRKASSRLASLGLRPESVQDPVIRKALRLAHAIADDDLQSAQRIIAHETSANSDAVHTLATKISTAVSVGRSSK